MALLARHLPRNAFHWKAILRVRNACAEASSSGALFLRDPRRGPIPARSAARAFFEGRQAASLYWCPLSSAREGTLNYAEIKYCDIANGVGVRTTLFVSGCRLHCPGCFNDVAWDFSSGKPFTREVEDAGVPLQPHIMKAQKDKNN